MRPHLQHTTVKKKMSFRQLYEATYILHAVCDSTWMVTANIVYMRPPHWGNENKNHELIFPVCKWQRTVLAKRFLNSCEIVQIFYRLK